jgi:hypothetical protein
MFPNWIGVPETGARSPAALIVKADRLFPPNDSPEKPTYIETVAGEGYRFIAGVDEVVAPATAFEQHGSTCEGFKHWSRVS